jgi:gamma-glutamylcyclotransferase (GGCT)/AIG2-like uncharacterized protein YtfP
VGLHSWFTLFAWTVTKPSHIVNAIRLAWSNRRQLMAISTRDWSGVELLSVPPQQRLFVYGTLMSSARGAYGQVARARLLGEAPHRVAAHTLGELYELGQYPGLVVRDDPNDKTTNVVHGQLVLLPDEKATLSWLDEYEAISTAPHADNEYVRQLRDVTVADGSTVSAWIYVYVKSVAGLARIQGGRWLGTERNDRSQVE